MAARTAASLVSPRADQQIAIEDELTAPAATWIVVNTHAHKERVALDNLHNQNYATYCPLIRVQIRHSRKTIEACRPLFPGYVFVALDPARDRWRPIMSTVGVRAVVRHGDVPARVDGRLIASLRAREVDGAIARPAAAYELGQQVEVAGGAFDGLAAKIIALDDRGRVVVLLSLLNRSVKTVVSAGQVRSL